MAQKLELIDPDLLVRLLSLKSEATPPPDPNLKEMNNIEHKMETTLLDDKLDDTDKLQHYNDLLQTYKTHGDRYKNVGRPPQIVPPPADVWTDEILSTMPINLRHKTQLLLNRIKNSEGKISWNKKGELVRNKIPIPDTNIVDLIHDVVRSRKTVKPPRGYLEFSRALGEINTPRSAIGNPLRVGLLDPTGKSPKVKRKSKRVVARIGWTPYKYM